MTIRTFVGAARKGSYMTTQSSATDTLTGLVVHGESVIDAASASLPPAPLVLAAPRPAALDPARVYLASLQPSGRRSMAARLRTVALLWGAPSIELAPWETLRFAHVAALVAHLSAPARPVDGGAPGLGLAPASVNATLAALRGVATAAWNLGLLDIEDLARIKAVKPMRGESAPAGRAVASDELHALAAACAADPGPAGVRDGALLAVLYSAGLRRAELAALEYGDYNPTTATLTVRRGKGRKGRVLPLERGAAAALLAWLALRGPRPGGLFLRVNKHDGLWGAGLSAQAVYTILRKRAAQAGLGASVSPHDLRRTFVGDLLDAGADIATVQLLAGHANVTTTSRYDRRGESVKRRAVDKLHFPYVAPEDA